MYSRGGPSCCQFDKKKKSFHSSLPLGLTFGLGGRESLVSWLTLVCVVSLGGWMDQWAFFVLHELSPWVALRPHPPIRPDEQHLCSPIFIRLLVCSSLWFESIVSCGSKPRISSKKKLLTKRSHKYTGRLLFWESIQSVCVSLETHPPG